MYLGREGLGGKNIKVYALKRMSKFLTKNGPWDQLVKLNNISIQDFEIIVVDNGSTDDSAEKAKENFPSINLLKSEKNLGYSGGCNLGAKDSKGEYIIFLNNDTFHAKNWIEKLIKFLDKNPQAGAAQPKILNAINKDKFDYAGGAGGFIDKYCFPFARGRIFNTLELSLIHISEPTRPY